jgi:hypothetical protein
MNYFLWIAAAVAAFMVTGHSTIGRKQFFLPMLAADFDATSKRVMTFVWHMSTASLVLAAGALIVAAAHASGDGAAATHYSLVVFVAALYFVYGVVHLTIVSTSGLPGAIYKQFQWLLFFAVGVSAWVGA